MSAIIVLTPVVITAWPMLASAIAAAAVSAGFRVEKQTKAAGQRQRKPIDLDVANVGVVASSMGREERIVVEREGTRVIFSRDARGRFTTSVEGELSRGELERIGRELAGRVVQNYVYRRVNQELQAQGFVTLEEDKGPDETIRLRVRRYEG